MARGHASPHTVAFVGFKSEGEALLYDRAAPAEAQSLRRGGTRLGDEGISFAIESAVPASMQAARSLQVARFSSSNVDRSHGSVDITDLPRRLVSGIDHRLTCFIEIRHELAKPSRWTGVSFRAKDASGMLVYMEVHVENQVQGIFTAVTFQKLCGSTSDPIAVPARGRVSVTLPPLPDPTICGIGAGAGIISTM